MVIIKAIKCVQNGQTRHDGFSLLEMIIVIAIIGTLSVFALGYYTGYIEDTKVTKARALMNQIRDASRRYALEKGRYPQTIDALFPVYLREIPKTPWYGTFEITFGRVNEVSCIIPFQGGRRKRISVTIDTLGFTTDKSIELSKIKGSAFLFRKTEVAPSAGEVGAYDVTLELSYNTNPDNPGADFRFLVTGAEIESATAASCPSIQMRETDGVNIASLISVSAAEGFDAATAKAVSVFPSGSLKRVNVSSTLTLKKNPASTDDNETFTSYALDIIRGAISRPEGSGNLKCLLQAEKNMFEYSSSAQKDNITIKIKKCSRNTDFSIQLYRPAKPDPGSSITFYYGIKKILEITTTPPSIPITLSRLISESTSISK